MGEINPCSHSYRLVIQQCKGVGTDETLLATAIVRYQCVMSHVMLAHVEMYGMTIQDRVRSETRGDFEALLMQLLEGGVP